MNWLHTIHVLGAVQGLFLAFVLGSRHRNSLPNKLLGAIMAMFTLELVTPVYHAAGIDRTFPALIGVTYPLPVLYSPLFLLYAKTLSEGQTRLRRSDLAHFLPFFVLLAYLIPFYVMSGPDKLARLAAEGDGWTTQLRVVDTLKFLYSFACLVAMVGVLRRHRARLFANFSSLEGIQLGWLRVVVIGGIALWILALGLYVGGIKVGAAPQSPIEDPGDYVVVAVAVFVYLVGYLGLRQREIFDPTPVVREPVATAPAPAGATPPSAYARSGLDEQSARAYALRLQGIMESAKPYRRCDLTLADLAKMLSLSPHNLSEVINTQLGTTFYEFVNGYRVREVRRRLEDPGTAHLTILSLGLDAGFNSKSSFNAVFKQLTGKTPSQYRATLRDDTVATS